jgi:hypothetical protein
MHTLGIWIFTAWAVATDFMGSFAAAFGRDPVDQLFGMLYLLTCTISAGFAFVLARLRTP